MPQDAFTLNFLSKELNSIFIDGKVNRIIQPSENEVVFTVYNGKKTEKLYISVSPSCPRITVLDTESESPLTAPNFCMLLRKHLLSSTIKGISIIDYDRIVKIEFSCSSEFFDVAEKTMYVELMGRYSNIILTENGKILGSNRGNFADNNVRPLICGTNYVFPPAQNKKSPFDGSAEELFDLKCATRELLEEKISENLQGISLSTAKEIVKAYFDCEKEYKYKVFYKFLIDFLSAPRIAPCVYTEKNTVKDFALFKYDTIEGQSIYFDSIVKAENYFFTQKNLASEIKRKKDRISNIVSSNVKKIKKRIFAISSRQSQAENAEQNKLFGELILSNLYRIKQGMDSVKLTNYYDGKEVVIPLEKTLSPSKNAEYYYKKYNKQKKTLVALLPQRQLAESDLKYFESVLDELSIAESSEDLNLILEELDFSGYVKSQSVGKKKTGQREFRLYKIDGYTVKAGRNNVENDKLLTVSKPRDIWIHAKDYHSSHLIIEVNEKAPNLLTIEKCCEICAYYSKGRDGGKTEIVYTEKKNVKKVRGSRLGFCTYSSYNSMTVSPNSHAELLKTNL